MKSKPHSRPEAKTRRNHPTYNDRTTEYARKVCAGEIVAGRLVRLACSRHLADLDSGPARGLRFNLARADRAFRFFEELLVLAEGQFAGQPFKLQPWQAFIIGSIFGWLRVDGTRRFRLAYIEVGKGNGKSPMAGGIGLYGLVADNEPAAEIYSAAVTKEQARILFRDAERMRESSPQLSKLIRSHVNNLSCAKTGSFFRAISSEGRSLDGKRVHMGLIDEIHEHPSAIVVDKIRAGLKARLNGLIFEITNSGFDRESVCWQHHEASRQILEGKTENDSWFAYICGLDEGDDWKTDKNCWVKANPNLGISIPESYLLEQVEEAIQIPAKENIVARLNFCVWTQSSKRAIAQDVWKGTEREYTARDLEGRECFGGLDLGSVSDTCSLTLIFPRDDSCPEWRLLTWFFCPEAEVVNRAKKGVANYALWADEGALIPTPGNVTDYRYIRKFLSGVNSDGVKTEEPCLADRFDIKEIAYDRWNATQLVIDLQGDGLNMVQFGQGFASFQAPVRDFLRMEMAGELHHNGNGMMDWQIGNLVLAQDPAGNQKPDKEKSGDKIDGPVTLIMALGRALAYVAAPQPGISIL
jgi:phage terminase large subunit-like protein